MKITFHGHELVSVEKTQEFLSFIDEDQDIIEEVKLLVKEHQFRFYEDTHPSTIKQWMRKLGKDKNLVPRWKMLMLLAAFDRTAAKPSNFLTHQWKDLIAKCKAFDIGMFYYEDLDLDIKLLNKIPSDKHKEALNNMIDIVENDFRKNNKTYLHDYLTRNYINKKDRTSND